MIPYGYKTRDAAEIDQDKHNRSMDMVTSMLPWTQGNVLDNYRQGFSCQYDVVLESTYPSKWSIRYIVIDVAGNGYRYDESRVTDDSTSDRPYPHGTNFVEMFLRELGLVPVFPMELADPVLVSEIAVSNEVVDVPAGTYSCRVYTHVKEGEKKDIVYLAKDVPGLIVKRVSVDSLGKEYRQVLTSVTMGKE